MQINRETIRVNGNEGIEHEKASAFCERRVGCNRHRIWPYRRRHLGRHHCRCSGARYCPEHNLHLRLDRAQVRPITAIEYALMASAIGATLAATVLSLGSKLKTSFYDAIAAMF